MITVMIRLGRHRDNIGPEGPDTGAAGIAQAGIDDAIAAPGAFCGGKILGRAVMGRVGIQKIRRIPMAQRNQELFLGESTGSSVQSDVMISTKALGPGFLLGAW